MKKKILFSSGELPAGTHQQQQEGEFEEQGQLSSDGASCQGQSQGQAECQGQAEGQGPGGEQGHGTGQDPGLFPFLRFSFFPYFGRSLSQPLLLIACNFFYCLLIPFYIPAGFELAIISVSIFV